VLLRGANNNSVLGNTIYENGAEEVGAGIRLDEGSSNNKIEENELYENLDGGIEIEAGSNWNNVVGNYSHDGGRGIHLIEASYNRISNNVLDNEGGIYILYDSHDNEVVDNTIYDPISHCISLQWVSDNLVKGNVALRGWIGISAQFASNCLIKSNTSLDSGQWDLWDNSDPLANTWKNNEYDTANFVP
jgi:parallel beta-helix repeat protein